MLTTDIEVKDGTAGNDTFKALLAATGSTLQSGDVINGKGGNDTLEVLVTGGNTANPAPAIDGVKTLQFRTLASDANADQVNLALATGYTDVVVTDSIGTDALQFNNYNTAAKLTVKNATANNTAVTVSSLINSVAGDSDTFAISFNNVGKIATSGALAATVEVTPTGIETYNVSNSGAESRVILKANGTTGDTSLATMNVDASARLQIADGSSLINLTKLDANSSTATVDVDLSSNTKNIEVIGGSGNDTFRFGTGLASGDTVKGGGGSDTVIATLASAMQYAPTLQSVETVQATFSAAAVLNLNNAPDVATLKIGGSTAAVSVTNAGAALKTVTTDTSNSNTFSLAYKTGVAGDLTVNLGKDQTTAGTGVALGSSTTLNGATAVTINSIGKHSSANETKALSMADAKSLTLTTANKDADLRVGNLTASKLETLTVTATAGDVTVGTLAGAGSLKTVSVNATGEADVTINAIGATTEATKLTSINLVGGEKSDLALGNVTAYDSALSAGSRTALTSVSVETGKGGSFTIGDITAGTDNLSGAYDGASIAVSLKGGDNLDSSSVGTITANEITSLDITRGSNTTAAELAVTAVNAKTIGNVNVTTGDNASVTVNSLGDDSSNGVTTSIGNVTVSVGQGSTVTLNPKGGSSATMGLVSASGKGSLTMTSTGIDSTSGVDVSNLEGTATIDFHSMTTGTTFTMGKGSADLKGTKGADIITAGSGGGKLAGWLGADDITLGSGSDTVVIAGGNLSNGNYLTDLVGANADTIRNFKAEGTDVIRLDIKESTATSQDIDVAGSFLVAGGLSGTSAVAATGTNIFLELSGVGSGTAYKVGNSANLILEFTASTIDGTAGDLVTKIKNGASTAALDKDAATSPDDNGWIGFIVAYTTAGDAQIWHKTADASNNNTLDDSELVLVATLTGVPANSLVGADFAFI